MFDIEYLLYLIRNNAITQLDFSQQFIDYLSDHPRRVNWDSPFNKLGSTIINGDRIVIAKDQPDYALYIYNIHNKQQLHELRGHNEPVWLIVELPNGNIASWAYREILIWNPDTGVLLHRLPQNASAAVMRVLTEVNPTLLAQPSLNNGNVCCWDINTGEQSANLFGIDDPGWYIYQFHQLADHCWLTASRQLPSSSVKYQIWNPERNRVIKRFDGEESAWGCQTYELADNHVALSFNNEIQIYNRQQDRIVRRILGAIANQEKNKFFHVLPDKAHIFIIDSPSRLVKVMNAFEVDPANADQCRTVYTFPLSGEVSRLSILGDAHVIYHCGSRTTLINIKTGTTLFRDVLLTQLPDHYEFRLLSDGSFRFNYGLCCHDPKMETVHYPKRYHTEAELHRILEALRGNRSVREVIWSDYPVNPVLRDEINAIVAAHVVPLPAVVPAAPLVPPPIASLSLSTMRPSTTAGTIESTVTNPTEEQDMPDRTLQIATGNSCTFTISKDGSQLYAVGNNTYHQIGLGDTRECLQLTQIPLPLRPGEKILKMASGFASHTLVLTDQGRVFGAGINSTGGLGLGNYEDQANFVEVPLPELNPGEQFIEINYGGNGRSTFLVTNQGRLFATGGNESHQLGLGHTVNQNRFVLVPLRLNPDEKVKLVGCGSEYSLLLTDQGRVFGCSTGYYRAEGLRGNTTVFTLVPLNLNPDEQVTSLKAGHVNSLLLTNQGRVFGSGQTHHGESGVPGGSTTFQLSVINGLQAGEQVIKMAIGYPQSFLLTNQHRVFACGWNQYGQLGLGHNNTPVNPFTLVSSIEILPGEEIIDVATSWGHSALLTNMNRVLVCGCNEGGILGLGHNRNQNVFAPLQLPQVLLEEARALALDPPAAPPVPALDADPIPAVASLDLSTAAPSTVADATESTIAPPAAEPAAAVALPLGDWHIPHAHITDRVRIGAGGFGEVYRANWQGHCVVAIKVIPGVAPDDLIEFEHEVEIMVRLRHEHIVSFFGICVDAHPPGIVMQFMVNGSLYHVLGDRARYPDADLTWAARCQIALDSCRGIAYLHTRDPQIIHRDIKTLNILLGEGLRARISDFGLSRTRAATLRTSSVPASQIGIAGTPAYMAPELWIGHAASKAVDIYALAIVLWELVTRERPFATFYNAILLGAAVQTRPDGTEGVRPTIPPTCPPRISGLIQQCWFGDRARRPAIVEVVDTLEQEHTEAARIAARR